MQRVCVFTGAGAGQHNCFEIQLMESPEVHVHTSCPGAFPAGNVPDGSTGTSG